MYIAQKQINQLTHFIPNFKYTFSIFRDDQNQYNLVSEYVSGKTLFEYLRSERFRMDDFLFLLFQLSLALQVAQEQCEFVHFDLTPWNIVLYELPEEKTFTYRTMAEGNVNITAKLVPVMIDYGKSHLNVKDVKHSLQSFRFSTIQDIIGLLSTSISTICESRMK